jgi:hypothetical protein
MSTLTKKTLSYGLGAGVIAGALDVSLVYFVEPSSTFWLLAQVFIAWVTIGWAVIATESGLPPVLHCIVVTIFLSLPWYIAEAILPGQWSHLPPLLIQSVVNGLIFAAVKKRMTKQISRG